MFQRQIKSSNFDIKYMRNVTYFVNLEFKISNSVLERPDSVQGPLDDHGFLVIVLKPQIRPAE